MVWWMIASQTKWTGTAGGWWINLSCLRSPVSGTQEFCNKTIKMTSSKEPKSVSLFQPKKTPNMDPGGGQHQWNLRLGLLPNHTWCDGLATGWKRAARRTTLKGAAMLAPSTLSLHWRIFEGWDQSGVLPLGDEGKFPQFPTLPMGCIWELSWTFLLVFLESFKQVWIASTKKTLLPPPVGLWVEVAANRYRGTTGIAAHVEDPVSFGPFGDGFWGEPDWKKMKMFPLPIGISHDSTRSQR